MSFFARCILIQKIAHTISTLFRIASEINGALVNILKTADANPQFEFQPSTLWQVSEKSRKQAVSCLGELGLRITRNQALATSYAVPSEWDPNEARSRNERARAASASGTQQRPVQNTQPISNRSRADTLVEEDLYPPALRYSTSQVPENGQANRGDNQGDWNRPRPEPVQRQIRAQPSRYSMSQVQQESQSNGEYLLTSFERLHVRAEPSHSRPVRYSMPQIPIFVRPIDETAPVRDPGAQMSRYSQYNDGHRQQDWSPQESQFMPFRRNDSRPTSDSMPQVPIYTHFEQELSREQTSTSIPEALSEDSMYAGPARYAIAQKHSMGNTTPPKRRSAQLDPNNMAQINSRSTPYAISYVQEDTEVKSTFTTPDWYSYQPDPVSREQTPTVETIPPSLSVGSLTTPDEPNFYGTSPSHPPPRSCVSPMSPAISAKIPIPEIPPRPISTASNGRIYMPDRRASGFNQEFRSQETRRSDVNYPTSQYQDYNSPPWTPNSEYQERQAAIERILTPRPETLYVETHGHFRMPTPVNHGGHELHIQTDVIQGQQQGLRVEQTGNFRMPTPVNHGGYED